MSEQDTPDPQRPADHGAQDQPLDPASLTTPAPGSNPDPDGSEAAPGSPPATPERESGRIQGQPPEQLDAAQKSLSDALRLSFWLLSVGMVVLVVIYLGSGFFKVTEQQRAVRLVFGKIADHTQTSQVYTSGGPYFNWPYPIGDEVYVPISPRTIDINQAFWYQTTAQQAGQTTAERAGRAGPLNPLQDGSLITGDASIVHGRYRVTYRVTDPVAYVQLVGTPEKATDLVTSAAERGIIHATAVAKADDYINGLANQQMAKGRAQAVLDKLGSGLTIDIISAERTAMPLPAFQAYQAVSNAENEKGQAIDAARKNYSSQLRNTAGAAGPDLYQLIKDYEQARTRNDPAQTDQLRGEIDQTLTSLRMPQSRGGQAIGGGVASLINEAETYRTQTVEQVRSEANNFQSLLQEYRRNPRIITDRLWQDAREQVFSNPDIEVIYSPTGDLWLDTTGDPQLAQQRQQRRLQQQQEQAQQQSQNAGSSASP